MPLNEQQKAGPYSPDVLNVHDKDLLWVREFGTEVTTETGDKFTTNAGASNVEALIDARLGMLNVNSDGSGVEAPRGSTFLFATPEQWQAFPESPELGPGTIAVVMYAHTLYKDRADGGAVGSGQSFADLILGSEDLIGEAVNSPLIACGISGSDTLGGEPVPINVDTYNLGGDNGPTESDTANDWGSNVYWRILMVTQQPAFKTTSVVVDVSTGGLAWQNVATTSLDNLVTRVGLGVRCVANGMLDWARLYSWVIEEAQGDYILPRPPETGGRMFTP